LKTGGGSRAAEVTGDSVRLEPHPASTAIATPEKRRPILRRGRRSTKPVTGCDDSNSDATGAAAQSVGGTSSPEAICHSIHEGPWPFRKRRPGRRAARVAGRGGADTRDRARRSDRETAPTRRASAAVVTGRAGLHGILARMANILAGDLSMHWWKMRFTLGGRQSTWKFGRDPQILRDVRQAHASGNLPSRRALVVFLLSAL
jgi:hypothetical protein